MYDVMIKCIWKKIQYAINSKPTRASMLIKELVKRKILSRFQDMEKESTTYRNTGLKDSMVVGQNFIVMANVKYLSGKQV